MSLTRMTLCGKPAVSKSRQREAPSVDQLAMPPKRQKTDAPEDVGHADKAEAKAQAAAAKPAAPKAKSEGKTQAAAAKAAGAIVQWTGGEATIGDAEAETGDEAAIEKQPLRHQQPVTGDEAAIAAEAFAALQGGQGTLVRSTHGQMALPNPLDVVCTKCGETVDPCGRGVRLVAKKHLQRSSAVFATAGNRCCRRCLADGQSMSFVPSTPRSRQTSGPRVLPVMTSTA